MSVSLTQIFMLKLLQFVFSLYIVWVFEKCITKYFGYWLISKLEIEECDLINFGIEVCILS